MARRIMHPALRLLIRRNIRAKLRRLRLAFRTPKGIIASLFMLGFFVLFLGQTLLAAFIADRPDPTAIRSLVPVGLLLMLVLTVMTTKADAGIAFLAAEVDFLFAGPFRRSELLLYKVVGVSIASAGVGLLFSMVAWRYVSLWIAGYCGITLALLLIQLSHMGISLLASTVREKAYTRGRRVGLIVIGAAIVFGLSSALAGVGKVDVLQVLARFRESWFGLAVLAPFDVFGRTMCAETLPELAGWGALATGIDLALVVGVLRLDANFLEASANASEKRFQMMQRARSSNPWAAIAPSRSKLRIPQFPRWGGAGPIAWRQVCTALRGSRRMLLLLLVFGGAAAAPMIIVARTVEWDATPFVIFALAFSIFYLPMMMQFDFRGDLDRIDVLKSLPISALAMVAGQLATPIVVSLLLQLLCLAAAAVMQQQLSANLLIAGAFLLPVNALVFALENLVFLLFPYRTVSRDLQSQGRLMMILFVKMLILLVLAGFAAAAGGAAYLVFGGSWPAFYAAAWAVAMGLSLASLPLLCWAYRRLDPGTDVPS